MRPCRLQAVRTLKKQAEKAKKKQDTATRQAELKFKLGNMSEEERAEWAARRKEVRQVRPSACAIPLLYCVTGGTSTSLSPAEHIRIMAR